MTYQEFKCNLCTNLLYRRENLHKDIRMFEKNGSYSDMDSLQLLRLCNMSPNGNTNYFVAEDMVCISWLNEGSLFVVHWTVRELYERYHWLGWQGALPGVKQYAGVCSRLVVRPYAMRDKIWELDNCICMREGDIVLILCMRIGMGDEDDSVTQVTRRMAEQWNIPDDQLLINALHRSNKLMPARLYHEDRMEFRLTTRTGSRGAIAFFYPGVREWVASVIKSDYYIGFFGDHEALIHSVFRRRLREMQDAVLEYNSASGFRCCLTDQIYRYDSACGRLLEV